VCVRACACVRVCVQSGNCGTAWGGRATASIQRGGARNDAMIELGIATTLSRITTGTHAGAAWPHRGPGSLHQRAAMRCCFWSFVGYCFTAGGALKRCCRDRYRLVTLSLLHISIQSQMSCRVKWVGGCSVRKCVSARVCRQSKWPLMQVWVRVRVWVGDCKSASVVCRLSKRAKINNKHSCKEAKRSGQERRCATKKTARSWCALLSAE
jgi:hypothetical protein